MIPKEAILSIAAVMGVSCAFGFVLRGLWDKAAKEHKEEKNRRWMEDFEADHDHWEDDADDGKYCSNCKYENREWWQEPCENCNGYNGWKARADR